MEKFILIGRMIEAKMELHRACITLPILQTNVETAKKDYAGYGHFASCGDFYEEELNDAENALSNGHANLNRARSKFNELMEEFKNSYPDANLAEVEDMINTSLEKEFGEE